MKSIVIILSIFYICLFELNNAELVTIINDGYGEVLKMKINNSVDYIIQYTGNQDILPVEVTVSSPSSTVDFPLLVVAHQLKHITSWQLPYIVNPLKSRTQYSTVSHILCPAAISYLRLASSASIRTKILPRDSLSNPTISLKSPSSYDQEFQLKVELKRDFFLQLNKWHETVVSVSRSTYFFYNFRDLENDIRDSRAVLIQVESETSACMLVSIQNSTCPVFDSEQNVKYDSYWQTMNFKAGIVITKKNYPYGFYVVMVVKEDDADCNLNSPTLYTLDKIKPVKIKVTPTISIQNYLKITLGTMGVFMGVFVICILISLVYLARKITKNKKSRRVDNVDGTQPTERPPEEENWRLLFRASSRSRKTSNYVWHVGIVALFYTFPVLQLVFTYQGIIHETGNEDLCYYNFLCAHPLGIINDFNHVFSNIGYMFLGLLFIIITYTKELLERSSRNETHGLPKPYGMFYALGFALVMEGILSASYHICPKSSNFQFDTSFMYVMTVLMIVNIYENRHSTGDKSGYAVFGILAGATTFSTIGLFIGEKLYFWIIFGCIQIPLCLSLSWMLDKSLFKMIFSSEERQKITYIHICRIILWVIANFINWVMIAYGIYKRSGFGSYLLMVFIVNGLFYTIFYISMKICYKERILLTTWILILLASIIWGFALYFFVSGVTSWEKSPAESRNLNRPCAILQFYDNHDIWHFLSAVALFLTFLVLLTLDEGLTKVPRADIVDFHSH